MKPRLPATALSVRQPWAELIVRGLKTEEYRSSLTHRRGKVLIYAAHRFEPAEWAVARSRRAFAPLLQTVQPEDLPRGVIIGSVEIMGCDERGPDDWAWQLGNARRFRQPLAFVGRVQPRFWTVTKLVRLDQRLTTRAASRRSPTA